MNLRNGWQIADGGLVSPSGHVYADDDPVSAAEIEQCLGIPTHVTLFFNHAGHVSAAHVVREAFQRQEREEEKSEVVRLRLSPREKAALQGRADEAGKTISAFVRDELCR